MHEGKSSAGPRQRCMMRHATRLRYCNLKRLFGIVQAMPRRSRRSALILTARQPRSITAVTWVGISGICQNAVGALSAEHMVLWRAGVPTQIPSLGGSGWNTPEMVNEEGDVVGFSDLPGDQNATHLNAHAFLWSPQTGKTIDMGTLPGDAISFAYSINNRKQIVGQSCGAGCAGSRAVLYENGQVYDLNALLDSASAGIRLVYANDINDRGEIAGLAVDTGGNLVGFRLIPDGTTSPQRVQAVETRSRAALNYHVRIGPFGRPIITR